MPEKVYIALIVTAILAQFFKPIIGVITIILVMSLGTAILYPLHGELRLSLILGLTFLLATAIRGFNTHTFGVVKLYLAFSAICTLSAVLNVQTDTFKILFEVLKSVGFALLLLSNKCKKSDVVLMLLALVAGGFANGVYALVEQAQNSGIYGYRSQGLVNQANYAGMLMYTSIPFTYFFYAHTKNKLLKAFFGAIICILILGITQTGSRSSMLATALICGLLFIKNIKRPLTVMLLVCIAYFAVDLARDSISARQTIQTSLSKGRTYDASTTTRLNTAKDAFLVWLYNPLFGVGPGGFQTARKDDLDVNAKTAVHNTYLQTFAETGVFGGIIFLLIIINGFKSIKKTAEQGDVFFRELAENLRIFFLALSFGIAFTNSFYNEIFWVWLAIPYLINTAWLVEKEKIQPSPAI